MIYSWALMHILFSNQGGSCIQMILNVRGKLSPILFENCIGQLDDRTPASG